MKSPLEAPSHHRPNARRRPRRRRSRNPIERSPHAASSPSDARATALELARIDDASITSLTLACAHAEALAARENIVLGR